MAAEGLAPKFFFSPPPKSVDFQSTFRRHHSLGGRGKSRWKRVIREYINVQIVNVQFFVILYTFDKRLQIGILDTLILCFELHII